MKIAIDLDDVVINFIEGYLQIYKKRYNKTNKTFDSITSYKLWKSLGISKEESIDILNEFYNSEYFDNPPFIDKAKENIHILSKYHQIFFVTARPIKIKNKTDFFINKHFTNFEVIHSSDIFLNGGPTKAEFCKKNNVDILIDDNKDHAIECANVGTKVLLLDKPWNRGIMDHKNIFRVYNWDDILNEINKIKK